MRTTHKQLPRAEAAIWMTIGVIAIGIVGFTLWTSFEIGWRSFLAPIITAVLLTLGGWFYRSVRGEPRLGAIFSSTAQIIGFAAVAAPLSYIAAAARFPLQDAMFDAWDRHLHFDWVQMMTFIALRPELQHFLQFAYFSFALQTVTTILALGIAGQLDRLGTFVAALVGTTLVTIAISAVYPAAGPWLFLDIQPAAANGFLPVSSTSWPVFLGLRDGTLHTVYGLNSEGIITFPSLHAALGILFATALWQISVVRWIAIGLNGLMLIATPAYGSHYLVDVIAGMLIAAACWVAVARLFAANVDLMQNHLATIPDPPSIVPEAMSTPETAAASRRLESV
ncbi:phosphatase PAP2 family protein [Bradyrhizobium sp. AZCC 1693]|uniref:phosphatase PAP2 family protein n=1 Tax=Bradyrhizobium sp. AZCC 1693 TaxID=3117029 RepID=UPI002FF3A882